MSSTSGRAGAYRVREQGMNVKPRTSSAYTRTHSQYSGGSQVLQYPKSVITFEFYDHPQPVATNMSDPNAAQLVAKSPQRRPGRVGRANSPKPVTRHQVGVKKLGGGGGGGVGLGGGGGGGKVVSQRTSSASPTTLGHYQGNSGYFTITAYLPFDGGKRLKVYMGGGCLGGWVND